MRLPRSTTALTGGLVLCVACDVFDAKLERRVDDVRGDEDAGNEDAGNEDAGADAGVDNTLDLANTCSMESLPKVLGSNDTVLIPLGGLSSNVRELGQCQVTEDAIAGADGFFQISANAGERWHFHLNAAVGQNLAIVVSSSCDLRECVAAADVCGTNESEHFTFFPKTTGTYVVVIDGIDASSKDPLELVAVHPQCGDGFKEHSEVCDDRNVTPLDGCDEVCRVELLSAEASEVEPNDDTYGANVIETAEETAVINGKIAGGACQPDVYLLHVPEGRGLDAQMFGAVGEPCVGAPPLELTLLDADREELRSTATRTMAETRDGSCPSLSVPQLPAGPYFLRVHHLEAAAQFDYQLQVSFTATEGM